MTKCAVVGCTYSTNSGVRMCRFPRNQIIRKKWLLATGRKDLFDADKARICVNHFNVKDLAPFVKNRKILKGGAIPTIHLPFAISDNACEEDKENYPRLAKNSRPIKHFEHSYVINDITMLTADKSVEDDDDEGQENHSKKEDNEVPLIENFDHQSESLMNNVTDLFICFCEVAQSTKDKPAWVIATFPGISEFKGRDQDILDTLPKFVYPCELTVAATVQHYSFVFPYGESKRIFGFCRHDPKTATVLVLLSFLPWHEVFMRILNAAADLIRHCEAKELTDFLQFIMKVDLPEPDELLFVRLNDKVGSFSCTIPSSIRLSTIPENRNLTEYYDAVETNNMLVIFASMLYERRIILKSRKLHRLSSCVQAAHTLLYPITWHHIFMPILPQHLLDSLLAPMPMTKIELMKIIEGLYSSGGYIVVAIVSDMGTKNVGLWKELNVGVDKDNHVIDHPNIEGGKIYVFADVPHLLKLIRNHYLDEGMILENEIYIGKPILEEMLARQRSDLKIAFTLTRFMLDVAGAQRMRVWPAAKLFSAKVSNAIRYFGERGWVEKRRWKETADFFKLVNDWFDVFNSSERYGFSKVQHAYTASPEQEAILNEMVKTVKTMRNHQNQKTLLPFQKGILKSINSLRGLKKHVSEKYGVDYLLTRRINQDCLENFNGYIRGMGASNVHPSALDFKHRLKWYILGKHSSIVFKEEMNCQDIEGDENLINMKDIVESSPTFGVEEDLTGSVNNGEINESVINEECKELIAKFEKQAEVEGLISHEALRYMSGFVAKKFATAAPELGVKVDKGSNDTWLAANAKSHLTSPSESFFDVAQEMEEDFNKFHGTLSIEKGKNVVSSLVDQLMKKEKYENVNRKAVEYLVKVRTFFRIRAMNERLRNNKRKNKKKTKQFVK